MNKPSSLSTREWLTRNVFAISMLSLFSDMSHELATAILPLFLASFGGGAAALGAIEGFSDAASSLVKLWMSHYADRVGKRKPILLVGYLITGMVGLIGLATAWWQILLIRVTAWMGRGARGPVREALLSESVPPEAHGRAFGFRGAMDTLGATLGPLIAFCLVGVISLRHIFLVALAPACVTILIVIFILKDIPHTPRPDLKMGDSIRLLPAAYKRFIGAVSIFGFGNFAHTLLVLYAVQVFTPRFGAVHAGKIAIVLYIFHNILYTVVSYPAGALGDRVNKMTLLSIGYALFGLMCLGFIFAGTHLFAIVSLFALAGIYMGIVDGMERAIAADLLPIDQRNIGYGALATMNSFGDLFSSLIVGLLWSHVSHASGFAFGFVLTLLGAIALFSIRTRTD